MTSGNILNEFDSKTSSLSRFSEKIQHLIIELLDISKIPHHSISSRVKSRESLENKINRKNKYSNLNEITDVVGLRITTYFEDDTKKITDLLEAEFSIDTKNSIDKSASLDSDQFGYRSIHLVASLNGARAKLREYENCKGQKFEIQIRSTLQHAWAEIEHDLGYKTNQEIPAHLRRRFSRIAGLLEIADQEFISIKEDIASYRKQLSDENFIHGGRVSIDLESLLGYVATGNIISELDSYIANLFGANLESKKPFINTEIRRLNHFKIKTISALDELLTKNSNKIKGFASEWIKSPEGVVYNGISLFYLGYVLAARNGNIEEVANYLKSFSISDSKVPNLAQDVINAYKNAS